MLSPQQSAQKLLEELNLSDLSDEKKEEVLDQLQTHFDKVIRRTLLERMDDTQFERFMEAMKNSDDDEMQAQVAQISSEIPGLLDDIQANLNREYELMKAVMS